MRRNPKVPQAIELRAIAKQTKGDLDGAVDDLRRFVDLLPEVWQGWYRLATVYSEKGDAERTVKVLETAIKLAPELKGELDKTEEFNWLHDDPEFKKLIDK